MIREDKQKGKIGPKSNDENVTQLVNDDLT